jgi:hypothetical protein
MKLSLSKPSGRSERGLLVIFLPNLSVVKAAIGRIVVEAEALHVIRMGTALRSARSYGGR